MLTHSVKKRNKQQQCLRLAVPNTAKPCQKPTDAKRGGPSPLLPLLCTLCQTPSHSTLVQFGGRGGKQSWWKKSDPPETGRKAPNSEPGSSSKNKAKGVSAHTSQEINMKHRLNTTKSKNSTQAMHARCQSCKESQTGGCLPGQGCFHSSLHSSKPGCCPGVTLSFQPPITQTEIAHQWDYQN